VIDPTEQGTATFGEYQTWYRVTGDLRVGPVPLVVLHGGPGCAHDYVLRIAYALLARSRGGMLDRVAVPTLLANGRHDEATPACVQPFADRIPDVRWRLFEHSSHLPHVEETDAFNTTVAEFLSTVD
jgi:pimeloyl-ACP methyl ester carboxylesterase